MCHIVEKHTIRLKADVNMIQAKPELQTVEKVDCKTVCHKQNWIWSQKPGAAVIYWLRYLGGETDERGGGGRIAAEKKLRYWFMTDKCADDVMLSQTHNKEEESLNFQYGHVNYVSQLQH